MKPYPLAFRQKIIDVYESERPSIRQLANRFDVAKSFIQKLLKQYQETGEIRPQLQGGSPPRKLSDEHLVTLMKIIEANNDATLVELCQLLKQETGIEVSRSLMGSLTQKLNYSVKKKRSIQQRKKEKISKSSAESFEKKCTLSQNRT